MHFIVIQGYIETGTYNLFKWGNKEIDFKCFEDGVGNVMWFNCNLVSLK